jgi:hypothetical protein
MYSMAITSGDGGTHRRPFIFSPPQKVDGYAGPLLFLLRADSGCQFTQQLLAPANPLLSHLPSFAIRPTIKVDRWIRKSMEIKRL